MHGYSRPVDFTAKPSEEGGVDGARAATRPPSGGAPLDAGVRLVSALRAAVLLADASLESVDAPAARREAVRSARRELKAVRAIAPLCRCGREEPDPAYDHAHDRAHTHAAPAGDDRARREHREHSDARNDAIDGVLEFSAKANQVLGTLRDRDALTRSIQRLSERFANQEARRVVRTVLLATLVLGESDKRDEAAFAAASIERARRSLRSARAALTAMDDPRALGAGFDAGHASSLLVRSFNGCRDELEVALRGGDLARLHECRKKASFLALALRPFEDEVPAPVRRLRSRAKRLASALGEDRDLALLDVEMRVARAQLAGSPLASAIDGALRLARLEAGARVEDAAGDFLRLGGGRVKRAIRGLFGVA